MAKPIPVILDVDTGSDDAVALLLAALAPEIELLGVTVTQGNRPLANCVENTLRVLDLLQKPVPVYAGCPAPMVRGLLPGRAANNPGGPISLVKNGLEYSIHPAYLDIPPAVSKAERAHACSFLVDTLRRSEQKITLVTVAPPTNIGMAFRMAPDIAKKVQEVVFMGGGVGRGNITKAAEANFFHDPEAVKIVLQSGVPVRMVTLNATHSAELSMEDADKLISLGTPAGRLAGSLIHTRGEAAKALGWHDGSHEAIHDALAVAAVIDPSVLTDIRRQPCDIDISGGAADGALLVEYRNQNDPACPVQIAYAADKEKFFAMLEKHFRAGNH